MSWRYGKNTRCPLRLVVILKNYLFVLFNFTAESVNCSLLQKNLEKTLLQFDLQKKILSSTLKTYRNIYRKNLSAIIYRLPISLKEIEIYRLSVSPRTFLKLSIIVIALVQKGLSCPSLCVGLSGIDEQILEQLP